MKKLLIALLLIGLIGCKKEVIEPEQVKLKVPSKDKISMPIDWYVKIKADTVSY